MEPRPLGAIADDPVGSEQRPANGTRNAESLALPERRAPLVDHAHRVDHGPAAERVERAGEAVRDDPAVGDATPRAEPDEGGAKPGPPTRALLGARRAGERHPVSVQAMLLALSLRLPAAAYAADGSKPEWIPQCSQRGSFPGPYSSHSIPSRSAS